MKLSLSRSSVLAGIVVTMLLMALPGAIRTIVRTGNPYLFTRQFFEDVVARLEGAGRLRFIIQPAVALVLGTRDGLKDMRVGRPPFLLALLRRRSRGQDLLASAFLSIRDVVMIAIILDLISQFLIFREVRPGAALLVGPALIAVPYGVSRSLANRIGASRTKGASLAGPG